MFGGNRTAMTLGLGAWLACVLGCVDRPAEPRLTVATFNIRMLPNPDTDLAQVATRLAETDADVIAVQEIREPAAMHAIAAEASARSGRDYRVLVSSCVGSPTRMAPGIVYDSSRVDLVDREEYPELMPDRSGVCSAKDMPGVLAVFESEGGRRLGVLSVHFAAFPRNRAQRRAQLARALAIARRVEDERQVSVVVTGDLNTTSREEIDAIDGTLRDEGYRLSTVDLPCSEYWLPPNANAYQPSLLDHMIVREGTWSTPEVLGMCAELACRSVPMDRMHPDFTSVSDHCAVRFSQR